MTVETWQNPGAALLLSRPKEYVPEGEVMTDDRLSILLKDLDIQTSRDTESEENGSSDSTISPPESPPVSCAKPRNQQKPMVQQPAQHHMLRQPTQAELQAQQQAIAHQIQRNMFVQQQLAQQQHFAQMQMQRLQQQQMLVVPYPQQPTQQQQLPPKLPPHHHQKTPPTKDGTSTGGTTHPWGVCYPKDLTGGVSLEQDLAAFTEFVTPAPEEVEERGRLREVFQGYFEGITLFDDALELDIALPINDVVFTGYADVADPKLVEVNCKGAVEKLKADGYAVQLVGESDVPILRVKDVKGVEGVIGLPASHTVEIILYSGSTKRTVGEIGKIAKNTRGVVKLARVVRAILGQCHCTEGYGGLSAQTILVMCCAVSARVEPDSGVKGMLLSFLQTFGWNFDFSRSTVTASPGDWPQKQHPAALISVSDPTTPTRNLSPYTTKQKQLQITQTLQYCFMSLSKWDPARSRSALSCVIAYRNLWPRAPLVTSARK